MVSSIEDLNIEDLRKINIRVPRYTSYPSIPNWKDWSEDSFQTQIRHSISRLGFEKNISVYIHIPFCQKMCLFCGCSVVLNRKSEKRSLYLDYLYKQMNMTLETIRESGGVVPKISQLHFGGGTPTSLEVEEIKALVTYLSENFGFEEGAELAMEIDPRTVFGDQGYKLKELRLMGFNRVSFGVQDTSWEVQEAVRRRQSEEMSQKTLEFAHQLGFEGINLDLIYGLPKQTEASFIKCTKSISSWQPSRIALYSFAYVPWMKKHQQALAIEDLPSIDEKLKIYLSSRSILLENGYKAIGMDHFALENDELYQAFCKGQLQRNFQGYSVNKSPNLLGFGMSATGLFSNSYFQNEKELQGYYEKIDRGLFPIFKGCVMNRDDNLRKWVIETLMCQFHLDKKNFYQLFQVEFDNYFFSLQPKLNFFQEEGYLIHDENTISLTLKGQILVRLIVCEFDAYYKREDQLSPQSRFSSSI